jgi:regulator of RNase E activity RraA
MEYPSDTDPDAELCAALRQVSTATLTSQLLRRGFRNTFLFGLQAQRPDLRMAGRALTLRYVPSREDLAFSVDYDNRTNVQRLAVESAGPGQVLVIDARGSLAAASFGHIIATRIAKRGAAGVVTDGPLRDRPSFADLALPSYCAGSHATTSSVAHHPADMNVPIACAGVLIMPGDLIVGDSEGVVAIPSAIAEEVAGSAREQEEVERFALELVESGQSIVDLYPLAEHRRPEFESWRTRNPPPEPRDHLPLL